MRSAFIFPVVAVAALAAGCQPRVGLPSTVAALSYKPAGCDYTVSIPPGVEDSFYPATSPLATTAPVHVHASYASDPSTSFAVNWAYAPEGTTPSGYSCPVGHAADAGEPTEFCTDVNAQMTQVIYGTSKSAVDAASGAGSSGVTVQYGHSVRYASVGDDGNPVDTRIHEAHVCGLTPATAYYYKVGNAGYFSKTYSLVTASPAGSTNEFTFGVSGDARDLPAVWAGAEQQIQNTGAVFQIFSGDLINLPPNNQSEFDAFFETTFSDNGTNVPASDVMAEVPIMPISGNHDLMSINYMESFAIPQGPNNAESAAYSGKEWYSFDYGNVHFIGLYDSTSPEVITGQEMTWLEADITAAKARATPPTWIFAFHHQPIFSCDNNHGNDETLDPWAQVFDNMGVDVVFNGHVHDYQRSNWLKYNTTNPNNPIIAAQGQGTLYLVSGAVGVQTYGCNPPGDCPFSAVCSANDNYMTVDVKGNSATFTVTNLSGGGATLDAPFTITK